MARRFDRIPEDVKRQAAQDAEKAREKKAKPPGNSGVQDMWSRADEPGKRAWIFRKKRANKELTREEIRAIKKGRRALRREMRQRGLSDRRTFELTAETLGLYFDKNNSFWAWLWSHWLGALLAALATLLLVLFGFAAVTYMRGFFTINLSDSLVREGYSLSDTRAFENPTTQLFASPAEEVPCLSICQIPKDVVQVDGAYDAPDFFGYTFYIRNEGDQKSSFEWSLSLNSESKGLSDAAWAVLFVDGQMRIYAKANQLTGEAEALPALDDHRHGYLEVPLMELAPGSDQFEVVRRGTSRNYYRVIPEVFESDTVIASGVMTEVEPMEIHSFTIILYLEGDDVDTNDSKIGGHLGVEIELDSVRDAEDGPAYGQDGTSLWRSVKNYFSDLWSNLRTW